MPSEHKKCGNKRNFHSFTDDVHNKMMHDLSLILKCSIHDIPSVFLNQQPKPLKIGIYKDILERFPSANSSKLNKFLASYTRSKTYLITLKRMSERINLDGLEDGNVTDEQKRRADRVMNFVNRKVFQRRMRRRNARRKAAGNYKSRRTNLRKKNA